MASDDYLSLADARTRAYSAFAISTDDAAKRLRAKEPPLLIDVREQEEYDVSHLPSARFISFRRFKMTNLSGVSTDRSILLYCTIGYRSGKIAQILTEAGYKDVHHIRGGIIQWFNEGRDVVRDGKTANEIHPYSDDWKRFVKQR